MKKKERKKGENDSMICELIRNDNVVGFISHVTIKNIPLSTTAIRPSIFEMNLLLNEKQPYLIEYAAFYGSIQIVRFLQYSNVKLEPSLWIYSIHSNNAELIHYLEENDVSPPNNSYETCLIEAIKCHHNDIAQYIKDNMMEKSDNQMSDELLESILRYYNYLYFPEDLNQKSIFFFLVQFNYSKIVNFIIEMKKNEFDEILILKKTKDLFLLIEFIFKLLFKIMFLID